MSYIDEQNLNRARGTTGLHAVEPELTEIERLRLNKARANVAALREFEKATKNAQSVEQWFEAQKEFIIKTG
jgi:hypothetical protein